MIILVLSGGKTDALDYGIPSILSTDEMSNKKGGIHN